MQTGYISEASEWVFVRHNVSEIVNGQAKRVQRSYAWSPRRKHHSCACNKKKWRRLPCREL
jgi:hypothetical protein